MAKSKKVTVIKARKRTDITDVTTGQPIVDNDPIGYVKEVVGQVPESYIKYSEGRKIDKNKYPELIAHIGGTTLPSLSELKSLPQPTSCDCSCDTCDCEEQSSVSKLNIILTIAVVVAIVAIGIVSQL